MAKRKRKEDERKRSSTQQKGELVERIVAMMHEREPRVVVKHDVQLPAKHGGTRTRQIDVLLIGQFAGYLTMLAIECKNYSRPVNVGDVGRFRDLLEDVGLSPQQGVLVSAGGVGSGALDRARQLGMKIFELSGLTADQLSAAVHDASQMMVFVIPVHAGLTVRNEVDEVTTDELMTLFDENGNLVAYLPDLIWLRWLAGEPPSTLGEYELDLKVPKGWHTRVKGRRQPILSASAKVKVYAAVVVLPGTASNFAMTDPEDGSLQRFHSTVSFEHEPGEYPVVTLSEESELEEFLQDRTEKVRLTFGRIRTPRMQTNFMYWPPSARLMRRVHHLQRFYDEGRIGIPRPEDLKGVEGTDLHALWEPVVEDYPALKLLPK